MADNVYNRHAIVILTAYADWIKYMLANWPDELNDKSIDVCICIEERGPKAPSVSEVRGICEQYGVNAKILKSSKVNNWFRVVTDNPFLEEYNMGMNVLLQPFFMARHQYKSVFFVDDDIIFSEGISKVFEYDCTQLQRHFGAAQKTLADVNSSDAAVWKALRKAATGDNKIKWEDYRVRHINSGQRLLHSSDFDLDYYMKGVERFFNDPKIRDTYKIWRTTGKNKWRAFMMDQRFETLVYIGMGVNEEKNTKLKSLVKIEANRPEKIKTKSAWISKPLYHNTTCSCKAELYERLVERGEINGINT